MEIRRATPEMFDDIYGVLSEFGGALVKDDWRRLLDYRFSDQDYRGWVGVVNGEVVGFLGAIFSERGGARYCGLTSWIVKKQHRKGNLKLLAPMFELKDHTLLNFSASPFTAALFKRLGFGVLDEELVLIPAVTPRLAPRGFEVVTSHREIEQLLDPAEHKAWVDHQPYRLDHVVVRRGGEHCWVAASKTKLKRMPVSHLHHVSNPRLFSELINVVQRELFCANRTVLSVVDRRLVAGHPMPGSVRWRLAQPRLYRPATPAPQGPIDSLYTELVLLNPRRWTFNH
jgi:hypothetical protein